MIPTTTKVQSLRFCRDVFTERQAKQWAKQHGYKYGKIDPTKRQYRIRQDEPDQFQPSSFRTVQFRPGVWAVIGRPISGGAKVAKKKKKASKKKRAPKKRAAKKRTAPKKKASKKKASKKRVAKKRKPAKKKKTARKHNSTPKAKVTLLVKDAGKTMNAAKLYHAYLKRGSEKIYLGHVVANNLTKARKEAQKYLKRML